MFQPLRSLIPLDRNTYDVFLVILIVIIAAWWSFPSLMAAYLPGGGGGATPTPGGIATPTPTPTPPGSAHLMLSPQTGSYSGGDAPMISLVLNTQGLQVGGVDVYLEFDDARLSLTGVNSGNLLATFDSQELSPGRWFITAGVDPANPSPFTGPGVLATLNFEVPAGATAGGVRVDFLKTDPTKTILSVAGQEYDPTTQAGTYTIN